MERNIKTQKKIIVHEQQILNHAKKKTLDEASQVIPKEAQEIAKSKPPNELKTNGEIVLDFIASKKGKQELTEYLNKINAETRTVLAIIKPGGIYDSLHKQFWKNFVILCTEEVTKAIYNGNRKAAEDYFKLITENKEYIENAEIAERDVFETAKESEYGKKMTDEQWRLFMTVAVRAGFDRVTALETLSEWGIKPPTLLQMPQKASQVQMIVAIQQSVEALRKLTSEQTDEKLEEVKDGKLERSERLLREECDGGKTELGKSIKNEAKKKAKGQTEQEKLTEKAIKEMAKLIAIAAEETKSKPEDIVQALNGKTKSATALRNSMITAIMQNLKQAGE